MPINQPQPTPNDSNQSNQPPVEETELSGSAQPYTTKSKNKFDLISNPKRAVLLSLPVVVAMVGLQIIRTRIDPLPNLDQNELWFGIYLMVGILLVCFVLVRYVTYVRGASAIWEVRHDRPVSYLASYPMSIQPGILAIDAKYITFWVIQGRHAYFDFAIPKEDVVIEKGKVSFGLIAQFDGIHIKQKSDSSAFIQMYLQKDKVGIYTNPRFKNTELDAVITQLQNALHDTAELTQRSNL